MWLAGGAGSGDICSGTPGTISSIPLPAPRLLIISSPVRAAASIPQPFFGVLCHPFHCPMGNAWHGAKGDAGWIHLRHGMVVPWAVPFLVLKPRDASSPQDPGDSSAQPSQDTLLPEGCSGKAVTACAPGKPTSPIWRTAVFSLELSSCLLLLPSSTLRCHSSLFFSLSGEMFFALPPLRVSPFTSSFDAFPPKTRAILIRSNQPLKQD